MKLLIIFCFLTTVLGANPYATSVVDNTNSYTTFLNHASGTLYFYASCVSPDNNIPQCQWTGIVQANFKNAPVHVTGSQYSNCPPGGFTYWGCNNIYTLHVNGVIKLPGLANGNAYQAAGVYNVHTHGAGITFTDGSPANFIATVPSNGVYCRVHAQFFGQYLMYQISVEIVGAYYPYSPGAGWNLVYNQDGNYGDNINS